MNEVKEDVLVYICYKDHLLYRNVDPENLSIPVRQTVGWLVNENAEAINIVWDRCVKPIPGEKRSKTGLFILKNDIVEMRKIPLMPKAK